MKTHIFHNSRLVCRWIYSSTFSANGKSYAGQVRRVYQREADPIVKTKGRSNILPIVIDEVDAESVDSGSGSQKRRATPISGRFTMELATEGPRFGIKKKHYSFGDVFCCAGGASLGAKMAGLRVNWGVDSDRNACKAYSKNFATANVFQVNAHDFPDDCGWEIKFLRVDIIHLSPPCCYFSPAHTRSGPNDQANFEALYAVGGILLKLKPRIATLEQTFGLLSYEEHRQAFKLFLNQVINAGYDIRYKIENLLMHGLPQARKRLLMIAAKRGQHAVPLPPFPKPSHGPGLKPITSVWEALSPLRARVHHNDPYHNPLEKKVLSKPPYDPKTSLLRGCITGNGGDNWHFSGKRGFTVRETSLCQSFPIHFVFTGTPTEAMLQVGNAFPPVVASALFKECVKTLKAFDAGLISAEDELTDLDELFDENNEIKPEFKSAGEFVPPRAKRTYSGGFDRELSVEMLDWEDVGSETDPIDLTT